MSEHGTGAKIAMDMESFESAICLSAMSCRLDTLTDAQWCLFITKAWSEALRLAPRPKRKVASPISTQGLEDPDAVARYGTPRGGV